MKYRELLKLIANANNSGDAEFAASQIGRSYRAGVINYDEYAALFNALNMAGKYIDE